ncbi:MAG: ABC transporter transmembrane domain-containing protein, partial [Oscillospiraceae bacterium]|nr:ABC transporter transmembrane domain-containing protein [Oscillospiraceae bacterium]
MLKYFKTIFKPFRWARFPKIIFVVGLFTGCLMFPLMQVFSGLMQKFLVNAVEYQRMDYMNYVYILAAAILFMAAVLNPLGCYMSNIAMQIYKKNLRELTMEKLLSYPCSFYEAYQTGDLITRLRDDLDALPASFDRLLLGLFYGGGSVIVMLTFNWQLSLYVIFLCLAESFVMAKISKKITENTEILQKIKGVQNQLLFDIIKSISFIKMASISRSKTTSPQSSFRTMKTQSKIATRFIISARRQFMLKYFKTIFKPFRWARFPKIIFVIGLFTGCLMFPLMQVFSGLMQKFLVNAVEYNNMSYMNYVYILAAAILF